MTQQTYKEMRQDKPPPLATIADILSRRFSLATKPRNCREYENPRSPDFDQCSRSRGHGLGNLFCAEHARKYAGFKLRRRRRLSHAG